MKKRILIILVVAMVLTGMMACASRAEADFASSTYEMGAAEAPDIDMMEMDEAVAIDMEMANESVLSKEAASDGISDNMDADTVTQSSDRKLIFRANYTIETTEFDADYDLILSEMNKADGYPQSSWVNGTKPVEYGDGGRYAELTLRIPISSFDAFITAVEGVGSVTSKSQTTDDVSAQYFDTESRIRVLSSQQERLEALLAKADKMEDIIVLEQEITSVMYQLDSYEGQKRQLDNLIDYTTVSITLYEVNEISTVTEGELGLGQKIVKGFTNVGKAMIRFFEGLLIVIVGGAPAWITIGLVVLLVLWLVKRGKRKKAEKAKK